MSKKGIMNIIHKLLGPYLGLRKEIYVIFISKTINALGALIVPFMTLLLSKKIGLSSGETGIYVAVVGILYIPSSMLGGKLSDTTFEVCWMIAGSVVLISTICMKVLECYEKKNIKKFNLELDFQEKVS